MYHCHGSPEARTSWRGAHSPATAIGTVVNNLSSTTIYSLPI